MAEAFTKKAKADAITKEKICTEQADKHAIDAKRLCDAWPEDRALKRRLYNMIFV